MSIYLIHTFQGNSRTSNVTSSHSVDGFIAQGVERLHHKCYGLESHWNIKWLEAFICTLFCFICCHGSMHNSNELFKRVLTEKRYTRYQVKVPKLKKVSFVHWKLRNLTNLFPLTLELMNICWRLGNKWAKKAVNNWFHRSSYPCKKRWCIWEDGKKTYGTCLTLAGDFQEPVSCSIAGKHSGFLL